MITASVYILDEDEWVAHWQASDMHTLLKIVNKAVKDGYVLGSNRRIYPWRRVEFICYGEA